MKNILPILLCILISVYSCSGNSHDNNDDDTPKPSITNNDPVSLNFDIRNKAGNIFESIGFNIYFEKKITMLELRNSYDSIIWEVKGLGRRKILNETSFMSGWAHNFFLPGEYENVLYGYKNNKLIYSSDVISVKITNNKDFLGYNWTDITGKPGSSVGYQNEFSDTPNFTTYQSINDNIPSITLFLWYNNEEDERLFVQNSKKILGDYISSLYTEPTYDEGNNEIDSKYEELFKYKEKDAYPLKVWQTPRNNIVLLKYSDWGYDSYKIYAEQNVIH